MKNSPMSAFVLLGAATLIGGVAWYAMDDDRIPTDTSVVIPSAEPAASGPRVMNLTPFEARKKGRLEAARREIAEYKKIGKVLDNGAIRVPDVDGSPLYIHPELIEGVGRYGEPLYAMAKYKRRAAVPLRSDLPTVKSEAAQPKARRLNPGQKSPLNFGEKPEGGARGPTNTGGGSDDDGSDGDGSGAGGGAGGQQPKDG